MTERSPALLDALAYLRPHPLTNGPILLDAPKVRSALAVIEGTLHVVNGRLSSAVVCPFNDGGERAATLLQNVGDDDPCPVCGDVQEMLDSERRCPRQGEDWTPLPPPPASQGEGE